MPIRTPASLAALSLILAASIASAGIEPQTEAPPSVQATLKLEVAGIENAKGKLVIALFACEKTYESNDNPAYHIILPVTKKGSAHHTFEGLADGNYAIKLFHDVNANGKLDTNWVGIPREPYGFSNNPRIRFGPPSFADAKFQLTEAKATEHKVVLN